MKKSLVRAALTLVVATLVTLPAAASAQTRTIDDATGDVFTYDTEGDTYAPSEQQVNVDLDDVVVKHAARKIVVRASYVDLKKTDGMVQYVLRFRTNEGLKRDVTVMAGGLFPAKGVVMLAKPNGDEVRCRGLQHDVDYGADDVTLTLPRRCVSNPRWVQAFTAAAYTADSGDYIDHGHISGMKEKIMWSKRIRRG
jgi:hypothetical protein